jgi:hypothetical protein
MAIGIQRTVDTVLNYDILGPDEVYKIGMLPKIESRSKADGIPTRKGSELSQSRLRRAAGGRREYPWS